jgi:nucleotidyltransferase substrate binding protein (TIGR01987 family)
MNKEIRWKQRFDNLEKASLFFSTVLNRFRKDRSDEVVLVALLQSFEVVFELSWKTMKDFLESKGYDDKTPKDVLKMAFQLHYVVDGHIWIEMLNDRNIISHIYNEEQMKEIATKIEEKYSEPIAELIIFFQNQDD